VNWKISNFEYLMRLNTLSGRTFSDTSQYPIMPWVLVDYTSTTLNLSNLRVFRNLSIPVGAMTTERLAELREMEAEYRETGHEPYLFSCAPVHPLGVLHWLIRLEPFTSQHIDVQGGKFDCASRLFWSIPNAFRQASSMVNDYRELIPEFFCSPDFLLNRDHFNLGIFSGTIVDNVVLPPWASSPYEFIYLHRKALESEYVSSNLQNWIDLIWGENQRGEKAERANNTFMPEMYDDIWNKNPNADPATRAHIEAIACHCGQIPPQLFVSRHPLRVRRPAVTAPISEPFAVHCGLNEVVCAFVKSDAKWTVSASLLDASGACVMMALDARAMMKKKQRLSILKQTNLHDVTMSDRIVRTLPPLGEQRRLCVAVNKTRFVIVGADQSQVLQVDVQTGKVEPLARQRVQIVSIVADGKWIATANRDSELLVHNASESQFPAFTIPAFASSIACCGISSGFHSVVFGTRDGSLLFCSLNSGSVTRFVSTPGTRPLSILITPFWGFVIVYRTGIIDGKLKHSIAVYSTNGDLIRSVNHEAAIVQWSAFTSPDAFDFVVMADATGRCFLFEAFYLDVNEPFFCSPAKVVSLSFLVGESAAVIVAETGALTLVHVPQ
jgi:hypothetical protein